MTGAWCRRERTTMAAPQASDASSRPRKPAEPHPQPGALTSASATRPTAAASSPAPSDVRAAPDACSSLLSGTTRRASSDRGHARPAG